MKKKILGFLYSKNVRHILKRFVESGTFHQAYTSYCRRVSLKPTYNCFLAKTLQVCFPTYRFSKAHCLILGIQFVCDIGKIEHCAINILNKTQSKFHPLNTVLVGINHKKLVLKKLPGGPIGPNSVLFFRKYFSNLAKICFP